MNEKLKICGECGQPNEENYEYCKNCGAPLKTEPPVKSELAENGAYTGNAYASADGAGLNSIDGIPVDEVALFIGKKAPRIIKSFNNMQLTGSKVSWCWPVAVLGFLAGPLGAALWFFYRKMYKHAALLSAIGFVLSFGINLLRGDPVDYSAILERSFREGVLSLGEIVNTAESWRANLAEIIEYAVSIATAAILGAFSLSMYKNFVVQKIKEYRAKSADPRYYKMGLSVVGGTSGGMVWLGLAIMTFSDIIIGFINNMVQ